MNQIFYKYYEYLSQKVLQKPNFRFRPSQMEQKQLENFVDFLLKEVGEESMGEEWVFNYMVYLFKERHEQNMRFERKIPLNSILGKKSYELYKKRHENWLYFNGQFCKHHNILFLDLNRSNKLKTVRNEALNQYEEGLKKIFVKDEVPIHLCVDTVKFNSESEYCNNCVSQDVCQIINN